MFFMGRVDREVPSLETYHGSNREGTLGAGSGREGEGAVDDTTVEGVASDGR